MLNDADRIGCGPLPRETDLKRSQPCYDLVKFIVVGAERDSRWRHVHRSWCLPALCGLVGTQLCHVRDTMILDLMHYYPRRDSELASQFIDVLFV